MRREWWSGEMANLTTTFTSFSIDSMLPQCCLHQGTMYQCIHSDRCHLLYIEQTWSKAYHSSFFILDTPQTALALRQTLGQAIILVTHFPLNQHWADAAGSYCAELESKKHLSSVEQATELFHIFLLSAEIELRYVKTGRKTSIILEGKCFIRTFSLL